MQLTVRTFRRWGNELAEKETDIHLVDHKVCIVPAPQCAMRYINYPRYLPRETMLKIEKLTRPRENHVQVLQGKLLLLPKNFIKLACFLLKRYIKLLSARSYQRITKLSTNHMGGAELSKTRLFYNYQQRSETSRNSISYSLSLCALILVIWNCTQ